MESHIEDLKVTIHNKTLIFPAEKTERKSMFLSNIEQFMNFQNLSIDFFSPQKNYPIENVIEKLKFGLSKLFVHPYGFVCGRLKRDSINGRWEIDINASGAGFAVASSEVTLDELGDLAYPNPAFRQLILTSFDTLSPEDQPLFIYQVTSFKCGGFALAIACNHLLFDGIAVKIFLDNLAAIMSDKPLAIVPWLDRNLLAARSPPRVTFPHPELIEQPIGEKENYKLFENSHDHDDLVTKVFLVSSDDIAKLKEKAKVGNVTRAFPISAFNVVTAHIWRCRTLSCNDETDNSDKVTLVGYAVDVRQRMNPPLPVGFTGNGILSAYAFARCKDLRDAPFSKIVELVSEANSKMTDEYVRSLIDCLEICNRGFCNDFMITSWMRLGLQQVKYPWGNPKFSCPIVRRLKNLVIYFPNIDGGPNGGINVLITLPKMELEKFRILFHQFLEG